MSTLKVLKEYLVSDGGYLLNEDNNGKTVMLSGKWGSGKTHFWLEDIKPQLKKENKKNIYISLYGRESIDELKFEVLREAYNLEVKENIISKSASMLSSIAPSLGEKSLVVGFDKLNKKAKDQKAEEILKSGSIVCLDDFERKSTKIDLNDLFGYISQLALDYNCKVAIILNSDVFEGQEANIFKQVKEKTVNKFFYFEPTIEELFNSIYKSKGKYKKLDNYKGEILNTIQETDELNARIYIQVLDNCLEWNDKGNKSKFLRVLSLITINFTLNHIILDYVRVDIEHLQHEIKFQGDIEFNNRYGIFYSNLDKLDRALVQLLNQISIILDTYLHHEYNEEITRFNNIDGYLNILKEISTVEFLNIFEDKLKNDKSIQDDMRVYYHNYKDKNKEYLSQLWKYGYQLFSLDVIKEEEYTKISNFVKSGILFENEDIK